MANDDGAHSGLPAAPGAIALSGRDILTLGLHQGSRVIAPAVIGGVALVAAAVVGYWQAANGLLRLMQVTSSELDFAILGRLVGHRHDRGLRRPQVRRPPGNAARRA